MQKELHILIKKCRISEQLSQQRAADELHLSKTTLCDYERGVTEIPASTAVQMAKLYNCPQIVYVWSYDNDCGRLFLPRWSENSLAENILDNMVSLDTMKGYFPKLIAIGRDGKIDKTEHSIFNQIKSNGLIPLVKSTLALLFTGNKKSRTANHDSTF